MQNGTVHYYEIQKKTKKGKKYQNKKKGETPTRNKYVNTVTLYVNTIKKHDIFFQFVRIYTCRVQFFGIL